MFVPKKACGSPFLSLSLSLPTGLRKGLPEIIPKVLGSMLPGQSPVTLCPQSLAGSCDSAARSHARVSLPRFPPPPPPRPFAQHTQRASCYCNLPAAGRRGLGGERPGAACVSRTGKGQGGLSRQGRWPSAALAHKQRDKVLWEGSPEWVATWRSCPQGLCTATWS